MGDTKHAGYSQRRRVAPKRNYIYDDESVSEHYNTRKRVLPTSDQFDRAGKWTAEEESYSNRLVEEFLAGTLTDCAENMTLRSYLAKKLNCSPMRISKKYAGQCIGKTMYTQSQEPAAKSARASSSSPSLAILCRNYLKSIRGSSSVDDDDEEEEDENNSFRTADEHSVIDSLSDPASSTSSPVLPINEVTRTLVRTTRSQTKRKARRTAAYKKPSAPSVVESSFASEDTCDYGSNSGHTDGGSYEPVFFAAMQPSSSFARLDSNFDPDMGFDFQFDSEENVIGCSGQATVTLAPSVTATASSTVAAVASSSVTGEPETMVPTSSDVSDWREIDVLAYFLQEARQNMGMHLSGTNNSLRRTFSSTSLHVY